MECRFWVGQKVECINATSHDTRFNGNMDGLVEGNIYIISRLRTAPSWWIKMFPDKSSEIWVYLEGIVRPKGPYPEVIGFAHTRFRPLIQTDISVFTALLSTTPSSVLENA